MGYQRLPGFRPGTAQEHLIDPFQGWLDYTSSDPRPRLYGVYERRLLEE